MLKTAPGRVVCLFDLHLPEHDPKFLRAALAFLRAAKPSRLVLGGDAADAEAVSRHGGNPNPPKVKAEFSKVRGHLAALRKAVGPDCLIDYLEGNHEERLIAYLANVAPALAGLDCLTLPALLGLEELGIKYLPTHDQPLRLGNVKIIHGHQVPSPGQYPARKLAEIWGEPGVAVLCGHFHRDQVFVKTMHPKPTRAYVVACGRTLNPNWYKGPTSWHHSIALLEGDKVTILDGSDGEIKWGGVSYR